jgi:hypothetical protein
VLFDGPSLSDCGCTLRLIHRDAYLAIKDRLSVGGSHFLPEMVCLALLRGLRLVEVPVNYRGRVGESKITGSVKTTVKVGLRMIALILRYWLAGRLFRPAPRQGRLPYSHSMPAIVTTELPPASAGQTSYPAKRPSTRPANRSSRRKLQ